MRKNNNPNKKLTKALKYSAGRDRNGRVSIRHRGGRHKRLYRVIDYKRDKSGIPAIVAGIEYDPNRGANIALLNYKDGEKRYIIAPQGLKRASVIVSGEEAEIKIGNALPMKKIPTGGSIHNLELKPGEGGKIVRGAGNYAVISGVEGRYVKVKLPSGEVRLINKECYATIGQVSNAQKKSRKIGKAGRKRWLGFRPTVRGSAQNPGSHPHGGGEGRSGIGMPSPKSPWGKKTLGKKTRNPNKYSNRFIVKDRRVK